MKKRDKRKRARKREARIERREGVTTSPQEDSSPKNTST
jgi:hypothetical protein